jgi:hypothetical protein
MKQEVLDHIDNVLQLMKADFLKAAERIETIKPGETAPAVALVNNLAKELGVKGPKLYAKLVPLFKNYPGIDVRLGAHGGLYRRLSDELPGKPNKKIPQKNKIVLPTKTVAISSSEEEEEEEEEE